MDRITGLPPSVAIEQRVTRGGGKSTVATVTEVYHFLRLLFSKLGVQHCPDCGCAVESQTAASVTRRVEELQSGDHPRFATLVKARKGFHTDIAKWARRQGFETLLVDGRLVRVDEFTKLERFREHTIEVLVGERTPADTRGPRKRRLAELVKSALKIGRGTIRVSMQISAARFSAPSRRARIAGCHSRDSIRGCSRLTRRTAGARSAAAWRSVEALRESATGDRA